MKSLSVLCYQNSCYAKAKLCHGYSYNEAIAAFEKQLNWNRKFAMSSANTRSACTLGLVAMLEQFG